MTKKEIFLIIFFASFFGQLFILLKNLQKIAKISHKEKKKCFFTSLGSRIVRFLGFERRKELNSDFWKNLRE